MSIFDSLFLRVLRSVHCDGPVRVCVCGISQYGCTALNYAVVNDRLDMATMLVDRFGMPLVGVKDTVRHCHICRHRDHDTEWGVGSGIYEW